MRIGIDLRALPQDGSPGAGIAHAARDLVNALITIQAKPDIFWLLFLPRGASPQAEDRLVRERTAATHIVRLSGTDGSVLRKALAQYPCDRLFVPSGAVPPGIQVPTIPWVHDLAIFDHPEWFPESALRRALTTRLFRRGINHAHQVLSVSECTKREIVSRFSFPEERVTVTHAGGDNILASLHGEAIHEAKQRARRRVAERGITNPFILCMGTLEPRKNIPFLLSAWSKARKEFRRNIDLVIAGRDGWKLGPITHALDSNRVYDSETSSHLHRIEIPGDDDRRDLLLAAELVALPSLYEGFGLVALEAMQAETALMSSNAGGLPEVVGEDGVLLPPDDEEQWRAGMVGLMNDEDARRELAKLGKARSQGMTWERAAYMAFDVLTKT